MRQCNCNKETRVIAHLDVDSFEVQVRGKAAGFSNRVLQSKPFVAHVCLIVCANDPAKKLGIVRGPGNSQNWNPRLKNDVNVLNTPYKYGKAENLSLRKAGDDIHDCIQSALKQLCKFEYCEDCSHKVPQPIVEKNSCDEFYVDLTNEVHQRRMMHPINSSDLLTAIINGDRNVKLELQNSTLDKQYANIPLIYKYYKSENDDHNQINALLHGALIVGKVLDIIKKRVGFVVSAGVGPNKLFSKLACDLSKPNGLAVLPSSSFVRIKEEIPFTKIPGLGGDTGAAIRSRCNIETISNFIDAYYRCKLWTYFANNKQQESFITSCLRGIDLRPVISKSYPEKITCGKTLNTYRRNGASTKQDFLYHFEQRFHEMRDNLLYEYDRRGRMPISLKLEIYEHGPRRPQLVFRTVVGFSWDMMENFLIWELNGLKNHDESLQEWKPIFGYIKSLINLNSSIPLFRNDGMYIRDVCRINFIAYF